MTASNSAIKETRVELVHENPFDPRSIEKQTVEYSKITGNLQPQYGVRMKQGSGPKQDISIHNLTKDGSKASVAKSVVELPSQFQKYSSIGEKDQREYELWGKSVNGYHAGGNYDENPANSKFSVRKYVKLKQEGSLSKISRMDEVPDGNSAMFQD